MKKSIIFNQKMASHLGYWKRFFKNQILFSRVFKNYWIILPKILRNQYPISLKIKNQIFKIHSYNSLYVISHISKSDRIEFNLEEDLVKIPLKNKTLEIFGGLNNGDIVGCFLKNDYDELEVLDKWVVDIGANIADSCLYFISNGAKKVIGIEPFPKNYDLAIKNVTRNQYQDRIEIVQAVCSYKNNIEIDLKSEKGVESTVVESKNGLKIKSFTLEEIIKKFQVPINSILKIDCEGCEDEIISLCDSKTLKHFSKIQIEYHNGYKNIKSKLEMCGFKTKISKPIASNVLANFLQGKNKKLENKIYHVGFILGKK